MYAKKKKKDSTNPKHTLKNHIFQLNYQIMESSTISVFLAKMIILIDTLQLMGFSIHPNLPFIWNNVTMRYTRATVKYFQVDSILRNGNVALSNILLVALVSFVTVMNLCMLYIWIVIKVKKQYFNYNKLQNFFMKPLGLYILI